MKSFYLQIILLFTPLFAYCNEGIISNAVKEYYHLNDPSQEIKYNQVFEGANFEPAQNSDFESGSNHWLLVGTSHKENTPFFHIDASEIEVLDVFFLNKQKKIIENYKHNKSDDNSAHFYEIIPTGAEYILIKASNGSTNFHLSSSFNNMKGLESIINSSSSMFYIEVMLLVLVLSIVALYVAREQNKKAKATKNVESDLNTRDLAEGLINRNAKLAEYNKKLHQSKGNISNEEDMLELI